MLRQLTSDILHTDPGSLSPTAVNTTAPMLMSAWATAPAVAPAGRQRSVHSNGGGAAAGIHRGKERAMEVEKLLKRMIDERKAGNVEAIVKTADYNAVMKSWVMSGETGGGAAERVEQVR
jgi:hypothetical protein